VHPIDFDGVTTTGLYTISVSGPMNASSPAFRIDTGPNVYGGALANSLFFYQSERDGPNFTQNGLRTAAGHVNDQTAMTYLTPNANSAGRFSGVKGVETLRLRHRNAAARRPRLPKPDGRRLERVQLHGRSEVRHRLVAQDVGRPVEDVLLPGRDRNRQRQSRGRPRHLAPATGRRHVRRDRSALPL